MKTLSFLNLLPTLGQGSKVYFKSKSLVETRQCLVSTGVTKSNEYILIIVASTNRYFDFINSFNSKNSHKKYFKLLI